ncbi:MAG: hypothetical protein KA785_03350 [Spirochaetaceae bacterium]|nr:hypothetical protein [Spirochaetaceae bacterium]
MLKIPEIIKKVEEISQKGMHEDSAMLILKYADAFTSSQLNAFKSLQMSSQARQLIQAHIDLVSGDEETPKITADYIYSNELQKAEASGILSSNGIAFEALRLNGLCLYRLNKGKELLRNAAAAERLMEFCEEKDPYQISAIMYMRGLGAFLEGDEKTAFDLLHCSGDSFSKGGDTILETRCRYAELRVMTWFDHGDKESRAELVGKYREILKTLSDLGDMPGIAETIIGIAELHVFTDNPDSALAAYDEALEKIHQFHIDYLNPGVLLARADTLISLEQTSQALKDIEAAEQCNLTERERAKGSLLRAKAEYTDLKMGKGASFRGAVEDCLDAKRTADLCGDRLLWAKSVLLEQKILCIDLEISKNLNIDEVFLPGLQSDEIEQAISVFQDYGRLSKAAESLFYSGHIAKILKKEKKAAELFELLSAFAQNLELPQDHIINKLAKKVQSNTSSQQKPITSIGAARPIPIIGFSIRLENFTEIYRSGDTRLSARCIRRVSSLVSALEQYTVIEPRARYENRDFIEHRISVPLNDKDDTRNTFGLLIAIIETMKDTFTIKTAFGIGMRSLLVPHAKQCRWNAIEMEHLLSKLAMVENDQILISRILAEQILPVSNGSTLQGKKEGTTEGLYTQRENLRTKLQNSNKEFYKALDCAPGKFKLKIENCFEGIDLLKETSRKLLADKERASKFPEQYAKDKESIALKYERYQQYKRMIECELIKQGSSLDLTFLEKKAGERSKLKTEIEEVSEKIKQAERTNVDGLIAMLARKTGQAAQEETLFPDCYRDHRILLSYLCSSCMKEVCRSDSETYPLTCPSCGEPLISADYVSLNLTRDMKDLSYHYGPRISTLHRGRQGSLFDVFLQPYSRRD